MSRELHPKTRARPTHLVTVAASIVFDWKPISERPHVRQGQER